MLGDDLVTPDSWDRIRGTSGPFGLPRTREAGESAASGTEFLAGARAIVEVASRLSACRICSYGTGAAFVEFNVKRLAPNIDLICTDYAPRTVTRLAALFPEAEVRRHDLLAAGPLEADLHLLYRIDTEFSDAEWHVILQRFADPVLLVTTELIGWPTLAREALHRLKRRRFTRAGYVRTEAAFLALWSGTQIATHLEIGDHDAYLLT
jgi:hypothetical protein